MPTRGFQSSTEYPLTIGVGNQPKIDSLRVIWPNNKSQTLKQLTLNSKVILKQSEAETSFQPTITKEKKPIFRKAKYEFLKHNENNHIDFNYEGLISRKISEEGPATAIGDLDSNGYDDFFIGGAKGQEGMIYLQFKEGKFNIVPQKIFAQDIQLEDTAAVLFDADLDGDLDLLVGSGGNIAVEFKTYTNRLYLNNGQGVFTKKIQLPSTYHNVSTIKTNDFDMDGDVDVFIGSRSVPGIYGVKPKHLLLENDGQGNFTNVTENKAYDFNQLGMVTDAGWSDIDNDKIKELIVVGDWMSPKVFKNSGQNLSLIQTSLDSLTGWWNTISAKDIDGDGLTDFLIGNTGNNIPYKPTRSNPIKLFINDFDNNGTIEQISTQKLNGRDMPIILKKELTTQIASLKKNSLTNSDYAKKSIDELFEKRIINNSIVLESTESKSVVVFNKGGGEFKIEPLPAPAQFSSINAFYCSDFDGDGFVDILLGGNNFDFKPQYSRLDGIHGGVLKGLKNGLFEWVDYNSSGFFVDGEIVSINPIMNVGDKPYILVTRNDLTPQIFFFNE